MAPFSITWNRFVRSFTAFERRPDYIARESFLIAQKRLLQPSHLLYVDTRPKSAGTPTFFCLRPLRFQSRLYYSAINPRAPYTLPENETVWPTVGAIPLLSSAE